MPINSARRREDMQAASRESPSSLKEKLIKIGARVSAHGRSRQTSTAILAGSHTHLLGRPPSVRLAYSLSVQDEAPSPHV